MTNPIDKNRKYTLSDVVLWTVIGFNTGIFVIALIYGL